MVISISLRFLLLLITAINPPLNTMKEPMVWSWASVSVLTAIFQLSDFGQIMPPFETSETSLKVDSYFLPLGAC